jgi:hypothetical protein
MWLTVPVGTSALARHASAAAICRPIIYAVNGWLLGPVNGLTRPVPIPSEVRPRYGDVTVFTARNSVTLRYGLIPKEPPDVMRLSPSPISGPAHETEMTNSQ